MIIGGRIRETRLSQQRSLTDVASQAKISAATLSRIENGKQGMDLRLFVTIAEVLRVSPRELLDDSHPDIDNGHDPLVRRIFGMETRERTQFWRTLAENVRSRKIKRAQMGNLAAQVEELLAQADFLREELDSVRVRLHRRK
jgi:transcriptional regulator with XRE-family HTH domain